MQRPRQLCLEDYTVGWICALPVELAAAKALLDEKHETVSPNDENVYCMGSIAGHIGTNPALHVATQMRAAFKEIRFGLMVGIGGGVPSAEADIRLGDVVVSQPQQQFGGVMQYDSGKARPTPCTAATQGARRISTIRMCRSCSMSFRRWMVA